MKKMFKKCLGISLSIAGGIIGVGFASGREIVSFFARYGFASLFFCLVSGFVFFILSYLILIINHGNKNCKNDDICAKNHEFICKYGRNFQFFQIFLFVSQLMICGTMFAGFRVLFFESNLNLIQVIAVLSLILLISFLIVGAKKNYVHFINTFLSIALLMFIFIIFIKNLTTKRFALLGDVGFNFSVFFMSIFYAGMNMVTVVPLLNEEEKFLNCKKERIIMSSFIGGLMFVLLSLMCLLILLYGEDFISADMIVLNIVNESNYVLGCVYKMLIILSVFTTFTTTARGAVNNFLLNENRKFKTFLVLVSAVIISLIGFTKIVDYLYPLFGLVFVSYLILRLVFFTLKKRKIVSKIQ